MHPLRPYTKRYGPTKVMTSEGYEFVQYEKNVSGYRQVPPYDIDTTYQMDEYRRYYGWVNGNSWSWGPDNWQFPELTVPVIASQNKARAKFIGKLGDSSSFGATLTAERRETWGMVVGTITRAALAAKQVSRMQFAQAARTLGLPYGEKTVKTVRYRGNPSIHSKRRHRAYVSRQRVMSFGDGRWHLKCAASGWLMWSYGVKPLMGDIYNGMDVLQRPCPEQRISASASASANVTRREGNSTAGASHTYTVTSTVKISAYVRVRNPNLWLANQLGLVNPVQWLNEAIPFSFVVDWFSNLSQVISQLTDFVGLDVTRPCTTQLFTCREASSYWSPWTPTPPSLKQRRRFLRALSIPTAKLQFAYERFNWQRGLNAISLLVGFLPRKSPIT